MLRAIVFYKSPRESMIMIFSEGSWANISAAKQIEPNQVFKWPAAD